MRRFKVLLGGSILIGTLGAIGCAESERPERTRTADEPSTDPTGAPTDGSMMTPGTPMTPPAGTSTPPQPSECADPNAQRAGASPMRRLTRLQYTNSVNDLLGLNLDLGSLLSEDEKVGPFSSNLLAPVGELHVDRYMRAAETGADAAVSNLQAVLPCDPAQAGEDACAQTFLDQLGTRAFRRPLATEERTDYLSLYTAARLNGGTFADGIRQIVRGLLQSPNFLYLVEEVPPPGAVVPASSYELASRLSYFLWNSMPDDQLFAAAQADQLKEPQAILTHAKRMLAGERAGQTIGYFHRQWLVLDKLASAGKDTNTFPMYTPELGQAMVKETESFADHVIRKGDGKLSSLFTLAKSPLQGGLFALYGVAQPADFVPGTLVDLNPQERAGLLTQPSFLGAHSHFNSISPVLTGAFIRSHIMCQTPPPPPANLMVNIPPAQPGETTRQRFDRHRSDPTCATCHQIMDPVGYGFANYDALGRYQTIEAGAPIDATGQITASKDIDGPFTGAIELSQKLGISEQVRECVMRQWFTFALGRNLQPAEDACSVAGVQQRFAATDYNISELLLSIVTSDAFRLRSVGGAQ